MMDDYGNYVTWKDLGDKLDEVYVETTTIRERITRIETYLKIAIALVPAAITFGPHIAQAFIR